MGKAKDFLEDLDKYAGSRNMFGPLKPAIRKRLDAFFASPDVKHWNDVYSIIIGADGWMTFWQAVIAVDPSFPKVGKSTGWDRAPDLFTARRALKYARELKRSNVKHP